MTNVEDTQAVDVGTALNKAIDTARTAQSWNEGVRRSPEDKVYAVARWAAAIQSREDAGLIADALSVVAVGPQQFLPPEGAPKNATSDLATAFVFGGSDWAVLYEGKDGKHYYTVKAGNNEVVDGSQGYATPANARRALLKRHPGIEIRETE